MNDIIVIAHNMRSTHNVGSLLRTSEGLGVSKVYLTGYTPHPVYVSDTRLPHLAAKLAKQINKTALNAEQSIDWEFTEDISPVIGALKKDGYAIYGLEQTAQSISMPDFQVPTKLVLILGREVEGIEPEVLALCDGALEIPMFGKKESFNVVQAAAMALYHCRFMIG